jgi:hypothetical protein
MISCNTRSNGERINSGGQAVRWRRSAGTMTTANPELTSGLLATADGCGTAEIMRRSGKCGVEMTGSVHGGRASRD